MTGFETEAGIKTENGNETETGSGFDVVDTGVRSSDGKLLSEPNI